MENPESKYTPGAIKAAQMIYETHKIESITMPCFGLPTEEYIQNIAGMIDQEAGLPDMAATIDRQDAQIQRLRELLEKCSGELGMIHLYHHPDCKDLGPDTCSTWKLFHHIRTALTESEK